MDRIGVINTYRGKWHMLVIGLNNCGKILFDIKTTVETNPSQSQLGPAQ